MVEPLALVATTVQALSLNGPARGAEPGQVTGLTISVMVQTLLTQACACPRMLGLGFKTDSRQLERGGV